MRAAEVHEAPFGKQIARVVREGVEIHLRLGVVRFATCFNLPCTRFTLGSVLRGRRLPGMRPWGY